MSFGNSEELLNAWLSMSMCIRGNRMVEELSFNEMAIIHILNHCGDTGATATILCEYTGLLKSHMNRLVTQMESKGYIMHTRDEHDHRRINIHLTQLGTQIYDCRHGEIMAVVDSVVRSMGEEKSRMLTELMTAASDEVRRFLKEKA